MRFLARMASLCALLIAVILVPAIFIAVAVAQEKSSIVSFYDLLAPWMGVLVTAGAGLVLALFGLATAYLKKWTGIVVDGSLRDTLQVALTNAAGKVVMRLGDQLKDAKFDTGHPAIKEAIEYVNASAADSVKGFGLTPDQIAEKIIAKVGVLTAADPGMRPTDISRVVAPLLALVVILPLLGGCKSASEIYAEVMDAIETVDNDAAKVWAAVQKNCAAIQIVADSVEVASAGGSCKARTTVAKAQASIAAICNGSPPSILKLGSFAVQVSQAYKNVKAAQAAGC